MVLTFLTLITLTCISPLVISQNLLPRILNTTEVTDARTCKLGCIDSGSQFCPNYNFDGGNCCLKNETCSISYICSTAVQAFASKYYLCPHSPKCGSTTKYIPVGYDTKTITYSSSLGNFSAGDVCGFQFYGENYQPTDLIQISITRLQGAYMYHFYGGYALDSSTSSYIVTSAILNNINNVSYTFPSNQRIYTVVLPQKELNNASFSFQYTLLPVVVDNGTSNTTNITTNDTISNNTTQAVAESKNDNRVLMIVAIAVGGFVFVALIALIVYCIIIRRKKKLTVKIDEAPATLQPNQEVNIFMQRKLILMLKEKEREQLKKELESGRILDDIQNETPPSVRSETRFMSNKRQQQQQKTSDKDKEDSQYDIMPLNQKVDPKMGKTSQAWTKKLSIKADDLQNEDQEDSQSHETMNREVGRQDQQDQRLMDDNQSKRSKVVLPPIDLNFLQNGHLADSQQIKIIGKKRKNNLLKQAMNKKFQKIKKQVPNEPKQDE